MAEESPPPLLEIRGVLGETLPGFFRTHIPALLAGRRDERVWMIVTTVQGTPREQLAHGAFFRPARDGRPAEFGWSARGTLHAVVRQFRLDMLRHLGPSELRSLACLAIWPEAARLGAEQSTPPAAPRDALSTAAPAARKKTPAEADDEGKPRTPRPVMPPSLAPRPLPRSESGGAAAARAVGPALAWAEDATQPAKARAEARPDGVAQVIDAVAPAASAEHSPGIDGTGEAERATRAYRTDETNKTDGTNGTDGPGGNHEKSALPSSEAPKPENRPFAAGGALLGNFYQDYFGFERMPFNNTPDTYFYFPTDKHQEALSRLIYAVSERKGFVMISGEIGAGKSTLCRALLAQIPRSVKTALVTQTHLTGEQLLQAIAEDLGIATRGLTQFEIMQALNHYLVAELAAGCTVCIIVDEAQNLSPEALEELRMISNLETEQEKLVQLILLGQPNLRETIQLPELRQLRQRIAVQFHLEPLSREETVGYIQHRIKKAGPTAKLNFARGAMEEVWRYAGGVPRLVNTLCDNILLGAFTRQTMTITRRMVREAAADLELTPVSAGLAQFFKFW